MQICEEVGDVPPVPTRMAKLNLIAFITMDDNLFLDP